MKFWIKLSVLIVTLALSFFVGYWRYCTWKNQRDAERFIAGARTLVIGKSSAGDVANLIKASSKWADPYFDCSPSNRGDCAGIVAFTNFSPLSWPYHLHLAVAMGLRCTLFTKDDKLNSLLCVMQSPKAVDTNTYVQEGEGPAGCFSSLNSENRFFKIQGFPTGFFGVCINGQTPADLRELAFNFDFDCFSRLRGCNTYEEMLPVLARKDLQ
jgi:hypothetical protein